MGCCLSTTPPTGPTKSTKPDVSPSNTRAMPASDVNGRSPPPAPSPVLDEETVKEVLSETPISKPPPAPKANIPIRTAAAATANNYSSRTPQPEIPRQIVRKIETVDLTKPPEEVEEITIVSEMSDASEMYSFSGSFSTTTVNDRDEGEVNQRVIQRSPAKTPRKGSYSGETTGARNRGLRSPAGRSALSPAKRGLVGSSPAQGRLTMTHRSNVGPTRGTRLDLGEGSGRRSRSPAAHGDVITRRNGSAYKSPASSSTGQRPGGRSPVRKHEEYRKLEKRDDVVSAETSESLDNANVSLECFIFL